MREEELIHNLHQLCQIKPKKEWVGLVKAQILGEQERADFIARLGEIFRFRRIFAPVLTVSLVVLGLFGFSQNSLPGDILYPVKKISEKAQGIFVSKDKQPDFHLELAKKRLEELNRTVKENQVKRLAPAMKEYEATKKAAEKEVVASIRNKPVKEAVEIAKKAAPVLNKINKQEKETYSVLGIEPSDEGAGEDADAEKSVVEYLIKGAEASSLTEQQSKDLAEVKNYYKIGDYEKALEYYLTSSLNK